jgi:LacI family transcriptional regulator
VINDKEGVSDAVRLRVKEAIAELGYVVNYSARMLASGGVRTLGVVVSAHTLDAHTTDLIQYIGGYCDRRKVTIIILPTASLSSGSSVAASMGHGMVGALLFVGPTSLRPYLPMITSLHLPTVVIETVFTNEAGQIIEPPCPCVSSDNRAGGKLAVAYLTGLGHQRIAFLDGSVSNQARLRYLGYRDALADADIPYEPELVLPGDWGWESGYAAGLKLLALDPVPTAVFSANDSMALGLMRACRDRGRRVPEDMSVIGFDDIPQARQHEPGLTTIRQPTQQMVERAVDALLGVMDRGEELVPANLLLPVELVERGTCAPLRRP